MKALANKLLKENKSASGLRSAWESQVIANNIKQLTAKINQLNKEQHPQKVEEYIEQRLSSLTPAQGQNGFEYLARLSVLNFKEEGLQYELARFSVNYSQINDLYWINDGMVGDHLEIALGKRSPETLEVHCEEKLEFVTEKVWPFILTHPVYASAAPMLEEITKNFAQNSYLTTNILMPILIENIIRSLGAWVWLQQNPAIGWDAAKSHIAKFQSLERLITVADWKEDIPLDFYTAALESKYIPDEKLTWAAQILEDWDAAKIKVREISGQLLATLEDKDTSDETKKQKALALTEEVQKLIAPFDGLDKAPVMVSLKVKLQFLIRRFKDDRNSLLHGHFADLDKKWKCYVNFSALTSIYKLIIELESLYRKNKVS
ncbi:hypothetical protein DJ568_03180 [Mucilaginibacter hurinus]|uniref:Uncharacterized protein n=2 Tax=Mucilaginibacter hurinus TaxID=2201324 RepID=A0A367GTY0_9SPHI|nr:hypothetical protein DJ568_03180 [Mucilaginibacter hurinus]